MSFTPARRRAAAVIAVLALSLTLAAPALAASTSTITRQDCLSGKISRHGKPVSTAECLRHVGQSVKLARTGFEVWIIALAGVGCLAGAVVLRRGPRFRSTSA